MICVPPIGTLGGRCGGPLVRHWFGDVESVYAILDNEPFFLSGYVGRILGYTRAKTGGVRVSGCGMDMGFHLVYALSSALFPEGFIPAEAGHTYGRNGTDPHERDPDGGYALNQKWL